MEKKITSIILYIFLFSLLSLSTVSIQPSLSIDLGIFQNETIIEIKLK